MTAHLPKGYYLCGIKRNEIKNLIEFVVTEIYHHFNFTDYSEKEYMDELNSLIKEDEIYFTNSRYQVLKQDISNEIYGSIRTTVWDRKSRLPIEKLFGLSIHDMPIVSNTVVWHIGRFVISENLSQNRIGIFKKMLYDAFYPVTYFNNSILFAECDSKLVYTLKKMGIHSEILGTPIEYICSETLPIYIRSEWLKEFIDVNTNRYFSFFNEEDIKFFSNLIMKITNETKLNCD